MKDTLAGAVGARSQVQSRACLAVEDILNSPTDISGLMDTCMHDTHVCMFLCICAHTDIFR